MEGDELGKGFYRITANTEEFDEAMRHVAEKLSGDLDVDHTVHLNAQEYKQASAEVEKVATSIAKLTEAFGDLSVNADSINTEILETMTNFELTGGQVDMLVTRLQGLGEVAGVNGNFVNGVADLREKVDVLTESLSQLEEGTAEYAATNQQLQQTYQQLQSALQSVDPSYRTLNGSLREYIQSTKEAQQATKELEQSQQNAGKSASLSATDLAKAYGAWRLLKRSINLVKGALEDYVELQDNLSANGGEVSAFATAWHELQDAITRVKAAIGAVFENFAPLISWIANFISENAEVIAKLITVAATIAIVISAINLLRTVLVALTTPLGIVIALVGALATVLMTTNMSFANQGLQLKNAQEKAKEYADQMVKNQKATSGVTKATKDYSKELQRLRRNFLESLKQIEINHNESIANIRKDLEDLQTDYENTIAERQAKFDVTAAEEAKSHQELVDELTTQLNFLQRYDNDYNHEKLERVKFALEEQEFLYTQETEARQRELDLQNAADKASYEQRRTELQDELNDELTFMRNHREDLKQVREVILLDEIDILKRQYAEQQQNYKDQEDAAKTAGGNISKTWQDYYDDMLKKQEEMNEITNKNISSQTSKYVTDTLTQWRNAFQNFFENDRFGVDISKWFNGVTGKEDLNDQAEFDYWVRTQGADPNNSSTWTKEIRERRDELSRKQARKIWGDGDSGTGRAKGGYTGFGPKFEVAGVVHRGEYVVPMEEVDQETGLPKAMGGNQYITINLEGTFATSSQERRKVAEQIAEALAQLNKAGRTTPVWQ